MMFEIHDKNAIVTGGASGIGYQCVKHLLEKGAQNVAIFDVSCENGKHTESKFNIEYGSIRVHFFCLDVSDAGKFKDAFDAVLERFNSLDIIINCAGIFDDFNWEKQININLCSIIRSTIMGIESMGEQNGGKGGIIVNVASILGVNPCPVFPIYSATKFGVIGASLCFGDAINYDRTKVKVITMCPCLTATPMTTSTNVENKSKFLWKEHEEFALKNIYSSEGQKPESVAIGIMSVIETANSGTMWVSEDNKPPCEIEIPEWTHFKKQKE